jgi:hypothetical protein
VTKWRKARWVRIQEIQNDIEILEAIVESKVYGIQGSLTLKRFIGVLRRTIYELEKGGL